MSKGEVEVVTKSTRGYMVVCKNCHHGAAWDLKMSPEEARREADIHLSIDSKMHGGHKVVIVPVEVITREGF